MVCNINSKIIVLKFKLSPAKLAVIIIAAVIIIDQVVKILVKTHFELLPTGINNIDVTSWFKIKFIENTGMAFGMNFGGEFGKLFLSLFRIALVTVISIQLYKLTKKATPTGVFVEIGRASCRERV